MTKEKKFNYVYVTSNLINGKQYIGDHSTNNLENDKYLGSGLTLLRGIKKYGKENFIREILEHFNTKEEAFNAQEKYINEYDTLIPNGYNISLRGGYNCKNFWSDTSKEKLSKSCKGRSPWNKGIKWSDEIKQKISDSNKGKIKGPLSTETKEKISIANKGDKNGFFGKTHSNESRKQMSKKRKGKKFTQEHKNNLSKSHTGEKNSMYGKYGELNPNFGSKRSEESKLKMRGRIKSLEEKLKISKSNKNRSKIECPHCNRILDQLNYKKWHRDKCKNKVIL